MQAEKRKSFAMRISSGILAAVLVALAGAASASQPGRYETPQAAFEQGLSAYKAGSYNVAMPALTEAAAKGNDAAKFFAEFYLARIYSDNTNSYTNHPKAFMLFRKLADENADIDPDDNARAPFVAKAFVALAGYARNGLRETGMVADPRRAANYLHQAANFFGDKDAQFELAKYYLNGEGGSDDVRRGLHYLSALSEQSYPAAQAMLAEMLWNGRQVKTDQRRALALITMAVENAPAHDRIWIEESYHSIFCAATQGTRQEADGIMARWRKMFARPTAPPVDRMGLGGKEAQPERQCSNGEAVAIHRTTTPPPGVVVATPAAPPPGQAEALKGSAFSLGFRAAGAPDSASSK